MLHTSLYYNKNKYERKETRKKQAHMGWWVVPCCGLPYWLLLHCTMSHPISLQAVVGVLLSSTLIVGPPLCVIRLITNTHQPSSLQAVPHSRVWCHGIIIPPLFLSSSCPSPIMSPLQPCEQFLTAVVGGLVVVVSPGCHSPAFCHWR